MKKKIILSILSILFVFALAACDSMGETKTTKNNGNTSDTSASNTVSQIETQESTGSHNYTLVSSSDGTYSFSCSDEGCTDTCEFSVEVSGTNSVVVTDTTITFNEITEETTASLTGTFYGNIVIDTKDNFGFELELNGFTLTSETEVPVLINSECAITAKKSSENYIYDLREAVTSEDDISSSIYSYADLEVKGKGTLNVKSNNNNGIHTKDNLSIKNLTLQVECVDNALKGNDGVKIESGNITLISSQGDGIKTTNSHVSSKGNQKGDVKLQGGSIVIYAACDGIDAAHDVIINEDEATLDLKVYTDKYSPYSEEITDVSTSSENVIYVMYKSTTYKYSILYSNGTDTVWYNSSSSEYKNGYYYYPITKPTGYTKFKIYIYSSSQAQGQEDDYTVCTSDFESINENYDTIRIQYSSRSGWQLGWTSYSGQSYNYGGYGGPGGQGGGMQEGNSDKGDYSTKGIKADNEISISAGTIYVKSYDDSIHTNSDVQLGEEGAYYYGTGNIVISGGSIEVYSNDDGVHADGNLTIENGTVNVTNSYEGLEGVQIIIDDGNVSVVSSDDGFNSTATTGTGIIINGGLIYVYAGGDGLDANTKTSYKGFEINGGNTVVISTSSGNSSLDTEQGYTYNGGYVIAICPSGGMTSEATKCASFSSVGTSKTVSLSKGTILKADEIALIKMPVAMKAMVIILGKTNASVSTASSTSVELDSNGVHFN